MESVLSEEKKFRHIGRIKAAQGLKGEVFVSLLAEEAPWLEDLDELHFGPPGQKGPEESLSVLRRRLHRKGGKVGLVLSLSGVDSREGAESLIGRSVFVPAHFFVSRPGEKIYLSEVLGFDVIDETRGLVGKIVGFSQNGVQDLLQIRSNQSQGDIFEVPFVEPILLEIQFDEEQVQMDIPLGLVAGEDL